MRGRTLLIVSLIAFFTLIGSACTSQGEPTATVASATEAPTATQTIASPTATPLSEPAIRLAEVESLEILPVDDDSTQVSVRLRGILANGCARIDDIVTEIEGDVITIAVLSAQDPTDADQDCTEEVVPFDQTVEVSDLAPGSYTVSAHGLQGTFTVAEPEQASEEATPVGPGSTGASLSGRVWHDLCPGSGATEGDLPDGCIDRAGFQANGQLDDEPGIEGLQIGLAATSCDASPTEFAITDADGEYTFDDLAAGVYCVSVDEADRQNQEILLTGAWTSPDDGMAQQLVTLDAGTAEQNINFGWDYEYLPVPEFDLTSCENSFAFVQDLSIPDDTEFAAGQAFTKGWLLRNNGTCPWTTDYSIAFVGGDQMSAEDSIPLEQVVLPGQTLDVNIDFVAPEEAGTYRANWQLADAESEPFGIDGFIEDAFWLRIAVSEDAAPLATAEPNSGTIGGVVWDDFCLNSDPGRGCIEYPEGSGISIADGSFGPLESPLADITISLATEACGGSLPPDSRIVSTTTTDEDGLYRFQNLDTGMYCIFMDALSEENVDFLIPGNWTWPATGVGRYTFFLDPGEQALDLDFGWDYSD